jgi:putative ABC transport system substrate-binding protein
MTFGIGRRQFISVLGGTALAWPLAARAQQAALPVVGFLDPKSAAKSAHYVAAFRQGLKEGGYIEGQNIAIEFRWAEGRYDQLPAMAADLAHRQVAVIAAISPNAALAAKSAATKIPIVFQSGSDPVEIGLVSSLNRPGGNLTGISRLATELVPKLLEVLHEVTPDADNIAFLMNPKSVNAEVKTREAQAAAHSLGLKQLQVLTAGTATEIDSAFAALTERRASALLIGQDVFFNNQVEQLAALALGNKVPAIYSLREFTAAGGLMSYGASLADHTVWSGCMSAVFSRVKSRGICRFSRPPRLSWSSISKPPRRSVSQSRSHCSAAPTRWSNEPFAMRQLAGAKRRFGSQTASLTKSQRGCKTSDNGREGGRPA